MTPNQIAALQAILAGNFINLALFLTALSVGDITSMSLLLVSWVTAYVAGALHSLGIVGWYGLSWAVCAGASILSAARLAAIY